MHAEVSQTTPTHTWKRRLLKSPITYFAMGVAVLLLDMATGPLLQFPVLFVIPVAVGAWFSSSTLAYTLAVVLPISRLAVSEYVDIIDHYAYLSANAAIRIAVLLLMAYFVARAARQQSALEYRLGELVRICAWIRTIEHEGRWISFEEYLERRFLLKTTHGVSPAEAERLLNSIREQRTTGDTI